MDYSWMALVRLYKSMVTRCVSQVALQQAKAWGLHSNRVSYSSVCVCAISFNVSCLKIKPVFFFVRVVGGFPACSLGSWLTKQLNVPCFSPWWSKTITYCNLASLASILNFSSLNLFCSNKISTFYKAQWNH